MNAAPLIVLFQYRKATHWLADDRVTNWLADDRVTISTSFDTDSIRSYRLAHCLDVQLASLINIHNQYINCLYLYEVLLCCVVCVFALVFPISFRCIICSGQGTWI